MTETGKAGAVCNRHSRLTPTDCTVTENTAEGTGGIYNNGTPTLTSRAVAGNSGNGIYHYGISRLDNSIVFDITNSDTIHA
ncbi:MAG: hypothetical protein ACOX6D_01020 [Thermoguttaceae bacterium]